MREGYKKIFWGFIFVTIHINLGCIQILPNFIGYMLIYYGIKRLNADNNINALEDSSKYCLSLVIMSLISFILSFTNTNIINNIYFNIIWINILNILEIVMIYKLLYGSCERVKNDNNIYIKKISIYVLLSTIAAVFNNIYVIFMSDLLSVIIVIYELALRLWIISLISKMYKSEEYELN